MRFLLLALVVFVAGGFAESEWDVSEWDAPVLDAPAPTTKTPACWKEAVGRGTGSIVDRKTNECPTEKPERSGNQCYAKCPALYEGVGPVCWSTCESTKYKSNGVVFCCETETICAELLTTLGKKLPLALVKLAMDISVDPANVVKLLMDFKKLVDITLQLGLQSCSKLSLLDEISGMSQLFNGLDDNTMAIIKSALELTQEKKLLRLNAEQE
ncbi:hypothetical protein BASA81_002957 [Batrachochytrium salamandrivorans]|nr:hypothetical protein BASA81_002957 [Batrachochytrium salamandrivorans]